MPAFQFDFVSSGGDVKRDKEVFPTKSASVDSRLHGVTSKILLTELKFKEASTTPKMQLDNLKSRYTTFNVQKPGVSPKPDHSSKEVALSADGIPVPKTVLFDPKRLDLGPIKLNHIGPGLNNQGNTCFLNSVLQCLTYCAPLFNYLATDDHTRQCTVIGFCPLCELKRHMKRIIDHRGYNGSITPQAILVKLKVIAKHMSWGRQEDAHEFLRFMVESMHKACLQGKKNLDKYSKETTLVNQVFGGYLRSQVMCLKCYNTSSTYETFMDLSLDIKNATSIDQALSQFVSFESLDGDNAYHCSKCRSKQAAKKHFTIHRCPNVLTLHLKRFGYSGNKLHKQIQFRETLNLRAYTSDKQGPPIRYRLFGITCHEGYSSMCGHYTAYIKTSDNRWRHFNDCRISPVSTPTVFNCQAYILFYVKDMSESTKVFNHPKQSPTFNNSIKSTLKSSSGVVNGLGKLDLGTPVKRPQVSDNKPIKLVNGAKVGAHPSPKVIPVTPKEHVKQFQPLADNRSKISFGLISKKTSGQEVDKVPSAASTKLTNKTSQKSPGLVPYESESSDSEGDVKKNVINEKRDETVLKAPSVKKAEHKQTETSTRPPTDAALDSPLQRKHTNADALCVTPVKNLTLNTSPSKVNSTTPKWVVQHHDALVSPSVASETSNVSTSSTSHWYVEDKTVKPKYPILPEGQHAGWKVEDEKVSQAVKDASKSNLTSSAPQHSAVNGSCKSDLSSKSSSESPMLEDPRIDVSDKQSLLDTSTENVKHKKHKKRKHKSYESDEEHSPSKKTKYEPESKYDHRRSDAKHEHKDKHKHKSKSKFYKFWERSSSDQQKSSRHEHDRHHKYSSSGSKDKHRTKSVDSDSDSVRGEKSQKTKNLSYSEYRRSDYDGCWKERNGVKTKSEDRMDGERKSKDVSRHKGDERRYKNGDGSDEEVHSSRSKERKSENVEWVEVTKKSKEVESRFWDSQIKDGYKRPRQEEAEDKKAAWDGRKVSDVAAALERMSSTHGYGESVKSWDGDRSNLDKEVDREKSQNSRRKWEDEYDEEFDQGKTKKKKVPTATLR